jgi:arsenate reductase
MVRLYGIRNCDTVSKARCWLDAHAVEYRFHDLRADGLLISDLLGWVERIGWKDLINRRGTTWYRLPESEHHRPDESTAIRIMLDNPTIIKRPILDRGDKVQLGFSEDRYRQLFRQPELP